MEHVLSNEEQVNACAQLIKNSVSIGVLTGAVWARTVGVLVAVISAFVSFAWLPWYPIWGVMIIAIDVAVIWALTAHGRDIVTEG